MVVAVVLIGVPCGVGFGGIVCAAVVAGGFAGLGRFGGENGCALLKVQMHVALEMDGEAEINSGRKEDHAAAGGCSSFNGAIDGVGVEGFAVAGGAELAHIEDRPVGRAALFGF